MRHSWFGVIILFAACVGKEPLGDSPEEGGQVRSGGMASGGKVATGGTIASGGTTTVKIPSSGKCTDTSSTTNNLTTQFAGTFVSVDGSSEKTYRLNPNWWNRDVPFKNQSIKVDGLSFLVSNPGNATSQNNNPVGYPAFFIGTYAGAVTKQSNLPKKVSELTNVYTVFNTNSLSKGKSNYNVAYDVWFTPTAAPLSGTEYSPPSGGAFLMVWYFKPDNRQPRGTIQNAGTTVPGVPGTWNVWIDNTNPPCLTYVSTTHIGDLDFDLNDFIQDSVNNKYGITPSMYLSIIFAGFEIWGGGDGLEAEAFCATVK